MKICLKTIWFALALLALCLGASGCKTTESDNLSSRPWNSPRSWENGLPTSINEGR
jgi:hypothetical protein